MGQKYQIEVGRKRVNNAISGKLDKGQHIILGEERPVSIRVGVYGIPNGTEAWGIRLDKSGNVPSSILQVDDPNYNGKIKFVKWGTKEDVATMIRCRYVPGHTTLDKDYQDLRLKVVINENSDYAGLITLQHGFNEFDEIKDSALVQMLKIHHFNPNSETCNPDAEPAMTFKEINEDELSRERTKVIDKKFECMLLVNTASGNPQSIKNLYEIVKGIEFKDVNKEDAQEVYDKLKYFADQMPEIFEQRVHTYKTKVNSTFEKLKSFGALDLTKDGFIVTLRPSKEMILNDIPAKGEKMLEYAFQNFLKPEVFTGIDKMVKIAEKIK